MKMEFTLTGIEEIKKMLSKERLRKVLLDTINDTARLDVKPAIQNEMKRVFDRPTPYTLNSVYTKLHPADMSVDIGLKEWGGKGTAASEYLKPQIFGGSRKMKRSERHLGSYYVPGAGARRNKYGNISGSQITQILSALKALPEVGYMANVTERSRRRNKKPRNFFMVKNPGKGLRDDTIRAARLGWNPRGRYEERTSWGLEPEKDESGKVKKLWLPAGLVIPLVLNSVVMRLRIRRPEGEPRYVIVSGSDMRPMSWNLNQGAVVIVESELDGLLISQEAGDIYGVVALGNAQAKPGQELSAFLKRASSILVSLDFDEAGARSAWQYWLEAYPNSRRWPTPKGKDPSDYYQQGGNIRSWIEVGLSLIKPFPQEWGRFSWLPGRREGFGSPRSRI
jgi:hypothetical protein